MLYVLFVVVIYVSVVLLLPLGYNDDTLKFNLRQTFTPIGGSQREQLHTKEARNLLTNH